MSRNGNDRGNGESIEAITEPEVGGGGDEDRGRGDEEDGAGDGREREGGGPDGEVAGKEKAGERQQA